MAATFTVDMTVKETGTGRRAPAWRLENDLDGKASLDELLSFMKYSLIEIAKTALKEEQEKGFDKNPTVIVDGKKGRSETEVSPFGSIIYNTRADVADVLEDIYQGIASRSPVDTGLYSRSNFVFHNGRAVAFNFSDLNKYLNSNPNVRDGDVFQFVNVMPYAGKLERRGVSAGRAQVRQVKSRDQKRRSGEFINAANGAYFLASRSAQRKYKFNSLVRFEFIPGTQLGINSFSAVNPRTGKPMRRTFDKSNRKYKGSYVYPSIKLIVQAGGVF